MTIITAQQPGKEEKLKETVYEWNQTNAQQQQLGTPVSDAYRLLRRRRLMTTVCAILLAVWLLLAAVIGAVMLFRFLHQRPIYGWCGADVNVVDDEDLGKSHMERLRQKVEIDANYEYEKIEVPRFSYHRPAIFVHDFKQNWTAIVDVKGRRCFIKSLDRQRITPPQNLMDLVRKMEQGYYEQNTATIREHFVARGNPLRPAELKSLDSWMISQQCASMTSYMLVPNTQQSDDLDDQENSDLQIRKKRGAVATEDFVQYVPHKGLVEYVIDFEK